MPRRRRPNIGRSTVQARKARLKRARESSAEREIRCTHDRKRARESYAKRVAQLIEIRDTNQIRKERESSANGEHNHIWINGGYSAMSYHPMNPYQDNRVVSKDAMSLVCEYCLALKFKDESTGSLQGNVKLEEHLPPPEPLTSFSCSRNEWLKHIGRSDLINKDIKSSSYRVCSAHFDESMMSSVHMRKLLPDAVPSKSSELQPSTSAQMQLQDRSLPGSSQTQTSTAYRTKSTRKGGRSEAILVAARTLQTPCIVCCVFGCRNNVREQPEKAYYPLPTQPERYLEWLRLINRQDLVEKPGAVTEHRVCSDHFDVHDFNGSALRDDAKPCLHLPKRHVEFVHCSEELDVIKTEPPDDADSEGYEIHLQPAPSTITSNPLIPITIVQRQGNTNPIVEIRPMDTKRFATRSHVTHQCGNKSTGIYNPRHEESIGTPSHRTANVKTRSEADVLKARQDFLRNATVSNVEHITLPTRVNEKSVYVQTTQDLMDKMNEPLMKKYEQEILEESERLKRAKVDSFGPTVERKKFIEACNKFLEEKMADVVISYATLLEKFKGNSYSNKFKFFALNLYLSNPQSYKFVQQFFNLPSIETIHRLQIPVRTGVNFYLINALKVKVDQMSAKDKLCTVCFGDMQLKKNLYYDVKHDFICGLQEIDHVQGTQPAMHAVLIMARGLYAKWKQPVAFALVAEKTPYPELRQWLYKTIAVLFDIGLNVKALSVNHDTEFLDISDISVSESFIEIQGRKIYQFFDVPSLFKNAREDFLKYDFHFGNKVAKLSHVLEVYNYDKRQKLRLMTKITDQHFQPTESSDDEKLSIELFSRSVAAAMNFHVNASWVHINTSHTVEFIQLMHNVFDILNSQKSPSECDFKKPYKGTEEQNNYLKTASAYLQQLQMVDEFGNKIEKTSFVSGLLITIRSLINLMKDIEEANLNHIYTKHLSKDCMESFFKRVRELTGLTRASPTPIMFARSFKKLFLIDLMKNGEKGGTELDLKKTLGKISDYVKLNIDWEKENEEQNKCLFVGFDDYRQLWPVPCNNFITGYLFWKCLEIHKCERILQNLCRWCNIEVNYDLLIDTFKEFNGSNVEKEFLLPLPAHLTEFIERLDNIFKQCLLIPGVDTYGFGRFVYNYMETETFEMPCQCFPMEFVKFLFIRIKIFHMVKEYNVKNISVERRRSIKCQTI